MGFGWTNFQEDDLDWRSLTSELLEIVRSDDFGKPRGYTQLMQLYDKHVCCLNTMGCGWFAGFVAGAQVAFDHRDAEASSI